MDRMIRVNELLKQEIGIAFQRFICQDTDCLLTVTSVNTSPDLRNAQVFISIYGSDEQKKDAIKLMLNRRIDIQQEVASNIVLKYTPKLQFIMDESAEKADTLLQLLDDINDDKDDDKDEDKEQ
jgi:ribosome-binding factor A